MSMETPGGLAKFPVTKVFMVATVLAPLAVSMTNSKYIFLLHYDPFLLEFGQYWRLLTFQLSCVNESDMVLVLLVWYVFRHLERLMGSYKYISMVSLIYIYNIIGISLLLFAGNILFPRFFAINRIPSGPITIIMSLLHYYKKYTPQIYEFKINLSKPWFHGAGNSTGKKQITWTLNDQFVLNTYIMLLLLNHGVSGLFTGFVGWIIGILIDQNLLLGGYKWRLPFIPKIFGFNTFNPRLVGNDMGTGISAEGDPSVISLTSATTQGTIRMGLGTEGASSIGRVSTNPVSNLNRINSNNVVRIDNGSNTDLLGDGDDDVEADDEPQRPLGVQFLDTFRR